MKNKISQFFKSFIKFLFILICIYASTLPFGRAEDQQSILYHYQTLIAAIIASFAAYKTIAQMQEQLRNQKQQQQQARLSQLAVFKQAIRLYLNKTQTAAKNCVMSYGVGYDSKFNTTVDKNLWLDVREPPPSITQDYHFISKVPAADIAHCLNLIKETEQFHKLILELHCEHIEKNNYLYCNNLSLSRFQEDVCQAAQLVKSKLDLIQ